ncbi:MAG: hypothetical protein MZV49_24000 [Rhodopseudomonas palustris]|nr:hypothetical protein [Rhodopseudomonas palustris]
MGVVLFAFGTSLPELAISLSATFGRKADVTIGEVYASNIFTQLVVLGICCLIAPIAVSGTLLAFAMPFLILASGVIQLFVTSGLRLNRLEALGLLGFYALFAASQFTGLRGLKLSSASELRLGSPEPEPPLAGPSPNILAPYTSC